jgi:flagellar hook-basal body complex protein FliE
MKEKEHLYEEAIKLKIQSNSFKDENLKLKTKIKILENELSKKEKAMEDLFTQNLHQALTNVNQKQSSSNPSLAPLVAQNAAQRL